MVYRSRRYVVSPYRFRSTPVDVNDVGRDTLDFIGASSENVPMDALLSHLHARYQASRATLDRDVRVFLDDCIARDILINADLDRESDKAIRTIHAAQAGISSLTVTNFGYEVRLGSTLTPGCQSCSRGTWAVFNVGVCCNLTCWFCPYEGARADAPWTAATAGGEGIRAITFNGTTFRSARDLQFQFSLVAERFDAIAWVGGEPMLPELRDALLPLIQYFHGTYPGYHQWLYTNGTYATSRAMRDLRDAGIAEVRFNLAATDFNRRVIANMRNARGIFDYLCLEIPMTARSYEGLMAHADAVLDTGLDQMNLAEFIVGRPHLSDEALAGEGRLYCYKGFITSPVRSRQYTYAVIQRAVEERWPVIINDCSNEYKYYKLSRKHRGPGIFDGCLGYWNNTYALDEIDRFNDRLESGRT